MLFRLLCLLLCVSALPAFAQSGRLTGLITDAATGETLPGVNVRLEGTLQGTASGADGRYSLIGVRPGDYTVVFTFVGYSEYRVEGVRVNLDRTTTLDAAMREQVFEGAEVVVTAEQALIIRDRTTTTSTVNADQLAVLPTTNLSDVVNLQAGVVDGHFRGGRTSEVAYLINGIPITNAFSGSAAFTVEQNMIETLEVISGVFNAEFGQALSGVVNVVTRDVPRSWSSEALMYVGAIASNRRLEFLERTAPAGNALRISDFETRSIPYSELAPFPNRIDAQLNTGGPLFGGRVGVRVSGRYLSDEGTRFGRRLFEPSDRSFGLNTGAPREAWLIGSSGDQAFVPLGGGARWSVNGSLVARISRDLRLDYNVFSQQGGGKPFRHYQKYVPDGITRDQQRSVSHIANLKYTLSNNTFASLSYGYLFDNAFGYVYEDPTDSRHVSPTLSSQVGPNAFSVGGNDLYQYANRTYTHTIHADLTSQIGMNHLVKTGVQARFHRMNNRNYGIFYEESTGLSNVSPNPLEDNRLRARPYEIGAFIQDKIELNNLIVNVGVRFDAFNPNYDIPVDWTQAELTRIPNPAVVGDSLSNRTPAEISYQLSPRLGVAFPISATGVLRFSAGLFFQVPPYSLLFTNPEYEIAPGASSGFFGNANLKPERTLTFEVGFQQGITDDLGLEATLFSKDIRNLTGTEIVRTPTGTNVVRFVNVDVGTVRGITLSLFQRGSGPLSWTLDYTLQFAEGTASDPAESFGRFQSGLEQIFSVVRLDWDRRHVLNTTVSLRPFPGFEISGIGRMYTGTPYTTVRNFVPSLVKNDADKPSTFTADLRLFYALPFFRNASVFVQATNITDALLVNTVFADTGQPTESIDKEQFRRNGNQPGGLNGLDEFFYDQSFFGPPRHVSGGLRLQF